MMKAKTLLTRPRCFCLLMFGSWLILAIITEEPFGLPVPVECKRLDGTFFAHPDEDPDVNKKVEMLRKHILKCFPIDWTVMLYKEGIPSSEMDFKQGVGFIEYIIESINQNNATRTFIKSKLDALKMYDKCAIIGNGGILENSGCGPEIDTRYDYVMRANIAPIRNFKDDVGTKTNFTVLNYDIIRTLYSVLSSEGRTLEKAEFIERLKWLNDSVIWYHKGARTRFWAKNKLRYLAKELKVSYNLPIRIAYTYTAIEHLTKWFWSIDVPYTTTGLNMYTVAIAFCKEITLYGFYPFVVDAKGRSIRHHYYEDVVMEYTYNRIHNIPTEFKLLQRLNDMGILHLKTSPCI